MVPYMLQVHCTDNEVSYRLDVDTWFRRWRFHIKRHNIDPYPSPDGTIWNRQRNNEKHDDALLNCDVHRFRTKSNAVFINRYLVFWLFFSSNPGDLVSFKLNIIYSGIKRYWYFSVVRHVTSIYLRDCIKTNIYFNEWIMNLNIYNYNYI